MYHILSTRVAAVSDLLGSAHPLTEAHVNQIRSLAAEIVYQHQYRLKRDNVYRNLHMDAISAWRLVCRTTDQYEVRRRVEIAVRHTSLLVLSGTA